MISTKYGTNLLMKLILPKKDCMDILLCGGGIFIMALVLFGYMEILSLDITCPNKMPSKKTKMVFFGFKEISYLLHLSNICFRCLG
jgi:hypothetical protein